MSRPRVISDRGKWIADAVRGQTVVHLGFADVGCELSRERDGNWLHAQLASAASTLVGLDIVPEAVEVASAQGYEAYAVDCTSPRALRSLGLAPRAVVLAGELIEHLDNPGGFLAAAHELCEPGGTLILTTPNARRLMDLLLAVGGREVIHPDHVAIHSIRTLTSMLGRHGWAVTETLVYMNPAPTTRPRTAKEFLLRLGHRLERALVVTVSPYVADGLIVVARHDSES